MARGRKPELKREGKVETVNGLVLGSRMVEKVMNARKSGGRVEKETRPKFRISGGDGSGFGRLMSKSSLDMALKHMVRFLCACFPNLFFSVSLRESCLFVCFYF